MLIANEGADGFTAQNTQQIAGDVGIIDVQRHIVVFAKGECREVHNFEIFLVSF